MKYARIEWGENTSEFGLFDSKDSRVSDAALKA
jgi:hypothetical protein